MMRGTVVVAIVAALAGNAHAQQASPTQPTPAAQEKPAPRPSPPEGQPNNVKVELSITDQAGTGAPSKRTVSMIVADRSAGSVRSQGSPIGTVRAATLNVDATPTIVKDSLMRIMLGLEYFPRPGDAPVANDGQGSLNQRITLLVESGKPIIVSQASDPTSDRKMIVELTATILK